MPDTRCFDPRVIDFHRVKPGCGEKIFSKCRDRDGLNSYEHLCSRVSKVGASIVDLGTGDGGLLRALKRHCENPQLFAVDLCAEELAFARDIEGAELVLACASNTSFQANSFDYACSHMSLMLMPNVQAVISESHRILKRGGCFLSVVSGPVKAKGAQKCFFDLLGLQLKREKIDFTIGDLRLFNEAYKKMFFGSASWQSVSYDYFDLQIDVPKNDVWVFLTNAYYAVHYLSPEGRNRLENDFVCSLHSQVDRRILPWRYRLLLITAVRL